MTKKLEGKVAVVTGANSGIGLATVKLFLQEGAKVVLTGRRQEALDEVAQTLTGEFATFKAEASSIEDSNALVAFTQQKYGKIDILFLNAGVAPFLPVSEITVEHYNEIFDINVKGPLFTIKAALPQLNDGAVIITNTSIVNQKGFPGTAVYSASKAALRSVTRVLANELSDKKIRTVSVAPGPIQTPLYGKLGLPQEQVEAMGESFAQQVPLGRFGSSEELAQAVLFLASSDASFINGVELAVDGGLSQV
ncbi:MAG: glucose 1-dehydrogenase [Cyclobacteriaceae bacterium]